MGFENHGNRNSFFVNHILKLLTVCTDSGWENLTESGQSGLIAESVLCVGKDKSTVAMGNGGDLRNHGLWLVDRLVVKETGCQGNGL